jgi:hypothetical protein
MNRQTARRCVPLLVLLVSPLAVLGAAGDVQLNVLAVHHVFHIVLPVVAFAVFAVFVADDVSKHGWPGLSWRLSAAPETA